MRGFSARQYANMEGDRFPLTDELKQTIQWMASRLPVATPRTVLPRPPPPVVVYADDEGPGHIAAVLFGGAQTPSFLSHTHAPCWLRGPSLEIGISEFELRAICIGVTIALTHFPNRPILLCAGNFGGSWCRCQRHLPRPCGARAIFLLLEDGVRKPDNHLD